MSITSLYPSITAADLAADDYFIVWDVSQPATDPRVRRITKGQLAVLISASSPVQTVAGREGDVVLSSTDITGFAEAVDDRVAALLTAGANITLTYNDSANTLTIASSNPLSSVTGPVNSTVVLDGAGGFIAGDPVPLGYDIGFAIEAAPLAGEIVARYVTPRAFTLPSGATTSIAKAGVAATGSTVFTMKKNGSSFGTVTFAASGTSGTFSVASLVSFAAGDIITITAPDPADATCASIGITLVGTLA